jgi:hypothetical protein
MAKSSDENLDLHAPLHAMVQLYGPTLKILTFIENTGACVFLPSYLTTVGSQSLIYNNSSTMHGTSEVK